MSLPKPDTPAAAFARIFADRATLRTQAAPYLGAMRAGLQASLQHRGFTDIAIARRNHPHPMQNQVAAFYWAEGTAHATLEGKRYEISFNIPMLVTYDGEVQVQDAQFDDWTASIFSRPMAMGPAEDMAHTLLDFLLEGYYFHLLGE